MSARPAFAHPTAYRPRSVFAGGRNPWNPDMPATSPFPSVAHTKQRNRPRVDITTLKIRDNVPLPTGRNIPGKYDKLFSGLRAKQCIECKPDEVTLIASSLRKYIKDKKLDDTHTVVSQQVAEDNDKVGRVWLWPKAEVPADAQHVRAASARAQKGTGRSAKK